MPQPRRSRSFPLHDRKSCCRRITAPTAGSGTPWAGPTSTAVTSRARATRTSTRSEEHTSELQSQSNLVCRLLLEKKKKHKITTSNKNRQHKNITHTVSKDA